MILVHSHLGVGWESTGIVRGSFGSEDSGEDDAPRFEPSFNPANAAIVVCDEDPTTSLIERSPIERSAIEGLAEHRLGEHILAGLSSSRGLLDHLQQVGITPEQLRRTAESRSKREWKGSQITSPSGSDAAVSSAVKSAPSLVRVSGILGRLADELASGRPGSAYSLLVDGDRLITQGRKPWPFKQRRLPILDGTANAEILRQFVPLLVAAPEIRVQRNARVVQVSNTTFYKGRLTRRTPGANGKLKREPTARLLEVAEFIEKMARKGKTLVVSR